MLPERSRGSLAGPDSDPGNDDAPSLDVEGRFLIPSRSPAAQDLFGKLRGEIIGQDKALDAIVDALERAAVRLHDPNRPLLSMLLPGPTGVGKTETVRALAKALLGHRDALTRISGPEYSEHFNVSKLLGSPPGYVGGTVVPILSEVRLMRHCTKALKEELGLIGRQAGIFGALASKDNPLSVILIDELEKAHPRVQQFFLGTLEDGETTLGDSQVTDFRNSIIIATTNAGSGALSQLLSPGRAPGFCRDGEIEDFNTAKVAKHELTRAFTPELLNRFDHIVVFNPLTREDVDQITHKMIADVQKRVLKLSKPFLLEFSEKAYKVLALEGYSPAEGARPLRRLIDQEIVSPLARLVASGEIETEARIAVDSLNGNFVFSSGGNLAGTALTDFRKMLIEAQGQDPEKRVPHDDFLPEGKEEALPEKRPHTESVLTLCAYEKDGSQDKCVFPEGVSLLEIFKMANAECAALGMYPAVREDDFAWWREHTSASVAALWTRSIRIVSFPKGFWNKTHSEQHREAEKQDHRLARIEEAALVNVLAYVSSEGDNVFGVYRQMRTERSGITLCRDESGLRVVLRSDKCKRDFIGVAVSLGSD